MVSNRRKLRFGAVDFDAGRYRMRKFHYFNKIQWDC